MKQFFANLLKEEEGQDIIEYAVLAFFISIVAMFSLAVKPGLLFGFRSTARGRQL